MSGPRHPGKKSCRTPASFPSAPPGRDAGLGWRRILGSVHLMLQACVFRTVVVEKIA